MIIVNFPAGINEINIPALNQWDYGQKIAIHGLKLPQITEVHFCDKTCDKALVRLASKILDDVAGDQSHSEVTIPDVLLENPHAIHAFIFVKSYESAPGGTETAEGTFYTKDGDNYVAVTLPGDYAAGTEYYRECGKVTYKINIPVNARTQPEGYPCDDASVQNFLSEAMSRINDATAVIEETANKSAKIYNIKDGLYYDAWMGSKEDYEALTDEQKEAANTLFIYDNKLKEQLESGEFVVGKAKTVEKTDFRIEEWKSVEDESGPIFTGGTYQIRAGSTTLPLFYVDLDNLEFNDSTTGIVDISSSSTQTIISLIKFQITADGKFDGDNTIATYVTIKSTGETSYLRHSYTEIPFNLEYRRIR